MAGHFTGLGNAGDTEQSGGNVAKRASGFQLGAAVVGDENERYGIGGVIGVWAAGHGINHCFGIAVIGGDDPAPAGALQRACVNTR